MRGLSLVAASGGHSSSRCAGLSLSRPLLLQSTGSRRAGSVVVAHGPSCSAACGIFPNQGSNPCLLHWQANSQPLRHQGSPKVLIYRLYWPRIMDRELRLMFLSEFWTPCSQILSWFKKCAAFLILLLALFWLFYETHITAFRLERVLALILGRPPHWIE